MSIVSSNTPARKLVPIGNTNWVENQPSLGVPPLSRVLPTRITAKYKAKESRMSIQSGPPSAVVNGNCTSILQANSGIVDTSEPAAIEPVPPVQPVKDVLVLPVYLTICPPTVKIPAVGNEAVLGSTLNVE